MFALSVLMQFHEIRSLADAGAYVERTRNMPELLRVEVDRMAASIAAGCPPPAFNFTDIDASAVEAAQRLADSDKHPLALAFTESATPPACPHGAGRLARSLRTLLREELAPAVERYRDDLRRMSRGESASNGVWAMPDGPEFYVRRS